MSKSPKATRHHNSIKLLNFLPLRADLLCILQYETPCILHECTKLFKNVKVCANLIQNFQDDSDEERPLTICSTNSLGQKGSHPLPIAAAPTKPTIQIRPLSQMQPTQQPFIAILPPVSSLLASASSNLQTPPQVNIKNGRYASQAN